MRCIASLLLCYAFICLGCLSLNIGGLNGFVRCAVRYCRVAFPLIMLSRLEFSLVLRLIAFAWVLVGVRRFYAIMGGFMGVCVWALWAWALGEFSQALRFSRPWVHSLKHTPGAIILFCAWVRCYKIFLLSNFRLAIDLSYIV